MILSGGQTPQTKHLPNDLLGGNLVEKRIKLDLSLSFKENMKQLEPAIESDYIKLLMQECEGHREKVAARMGVSVKTLYNRLKQLEQ